MVTVRAKTSCGGCLEPLGRFSSQPMNPQLNSCHLHPHLLAPPRTLLNLDSQDEIPVVLSPELGAPPQRARVAGFLCPHSLRHGLLGLPRRQRLLWSCPPLLARPPPAGAPFYPLARGPARSWWRPLDSFLPLDIHEHPETPVIKQENFQIWEKGKVGGAGRGSLPSLLRSGYQVKFGNTLESLVSKQDIQLLGKKKANESRCTAMATPCPMPVTRGSRHRASPSRVSSSPWRVWVTTALVSGGSSSQRPLCLTPGDIS